MINYKKISGFFSKYINQISILLFLIVFFAINLYDMKYKFNKAMISGNKYYIVFSILTLSPANIPVIAVSIFGIFL